MLYYCTLSVFHNHSLLSLLTLLRCRSTLSVLYAYDLYPLLPDSALSYLNYSSIPFRRLTV